MSGTITGSNSGIRKIGSGTLTLSGSNSLGGLAIVNGTVAATHEGALGAANGRLDFGGFLLTDTARGTLKLLSSFNFSSTRSITINQGGAAIDTNGFDMTIAPGIVGSDFNLGDIGTLIKTGAGSTLALTCQR